MKFLPLMGDESRDEYKEILSYLHFLFFPFTSSKTLTYNLYSLLSLEFFFGGFGLSNSLNLCFCVYQKKKKM